MLFTTSRSALLEYLRNLTPQVLIFTAAIIFSSNLNVNQFDFCNMWASLPFLLAMLIFFVALIANNLNFFESSAMSLESVNRASALLQRRGIKNWKWVCAISKYIWRKKKIFFLEVGVTFIIVQVGFLIVLFTSFTTAASIYKNLH